MDKKAEQANVNQTLLSELTSCSQVTEELHRLQEELEIRGQRIAQLEKANQALLTEVERLRKVEDRHLEEREQMAKERTAQLAESKLIHALVIQLTRLAEEAKLAALVREQEKAARARAKQELKDSQRRLGLLIQQMPVAIVEWNTKFEIEEWNPAAERIFGYNKEEVLGLPFSFLVPDSEQVYVSQIVSKLLSQQGGSWSINENLTKDDRTITCEWYNTPLITLSGELVGVASMALDITTRKQAEEALQQANELLEQRVVERTADLANLNQALQVEVSQRQRAEQVARGQTEALVKTLTVLAAEPLLDNFLGCVLQEIADQLGDRSGGLYLYSEEHDITLLHINYEEGQLQQGAQISHPAATQPPPKQWDAVYMPLLRQNQLLIHNERDFAQSPAYAPYRKNNAQRGIKTLLVVPLLFGETFLGNITLRSTVRRDYKLEELELARVLAYQATLALQLTRLAEQAQQSAVLKERNRIAREIHDTLAQTLTGITLNQEAAKSLLNAECVSTVQQSQAQQHITSTLALAREGLAEARRSVWALRPGSLEHADLPNALGDLIRRIAADTKEHEYRVIGTPFTLLPEVEGNLLRIGQEAITNVLKHALANKLSVELIFAREEVRLIVQDDGKGFECDRHSVSGFGLVSMRERASSIGAYLSVTSAPGQGTEVSVIVPMSRPNFDLTSSSQPSGNEQKTRILIADDHPVVREGVAALLKREPDMTVIAQASNGKQAVELFRQYQPHVGLIDLRMPEMSGVEAITAICAEEPDARLVVLTMYGSDEDIYRGLRAGAKGYLLKDTPREQLLECIRTVYQGQSYIPSQVGAKLVARMSAPPLSDRERSVLRLIAVGKNNRDIGTALGIAEGTVKLHINSILSKFQVDNRTHAVLMAIERGIIDL